MGVEAGTNSTENKNQMSHRPSDPARKASIGFDSAIINPPFCNKRLTMTRSNTAYTVSYDSQSHWSVITQMWGSKWPTVIPYCLFNVGVMIVLTILDYQFKGQYRIEVSTQGHTFLTLVVSFLLVSRVNIGLSRYNAARDCLGIMYRESRELIQTMCVFTADHQTPAAKAWRQELAYRTCLLLRTAMAVVNFPTTREPAWDIAELNGEEREDVKNSILIAPELKDRWSQSPLKVQGVWQETMRVPIRVAYLLRKTIHSQHKRLVDPMPMTQENRLLASVDGFMNGYYGIRKFLTTPVPFPLIQMARTLLFLYVFTVPFVMLSDASSPIAHCAAVFVMTFGFLGLEMVS